MMLNRILQMESKTHLKKNYPNLLILQIRLHIRSLPKL